MGRLVVMASWISEPLIQMLRQRGANGVEHAADVVTKILLKQKKKKKKAINYLDSSSC